MDKKTVYGFGRYLEIDYGEIEDDSDGYRDTDYGWFC